jgi:hypothetical protein
LADTIGGARVALVCAVIEAIGQALIWLAVRPEMALAGAALTGFGFSLVYPGFGVEAVRRVPAQSRGLAMGAYTAFLDLAQGLASPALGLITTGARLNVLFLASAITVLGAALVASWLMAHPFTVERMSAMRKLAATLFYFSLLVVGASAVGQTSIKGANLMSKSEDVRAVAPALEMYEQKLFGRRSMEATRSLSSRSQRRHGRGTHRA